MKKILELIVNILLASVIIYGMLKLFVFAFDVGFSVNYYQALFVTLAYTIISVETK